MRKFLFILPLIIVGVAHGEVTRCIYLNPAMTCTAGGDLDTYNGKANWDATCTDSAGTTKITGAWHCSDYGASQGATTDMLRTDGSTSTNKNCWCKMLTPAVSMWVFHSSVGNQGTCHYTCGRLCLEALQATGTTEFKTNMFNNLGV